MSKLSSFYSMFKNYSLVQKFDLNLEPNLRKAVHDICYISSWQIQYVKNDKMNHA